MTPPPTSSESKETPSPSATEPPSNTSPPYTTIWLGVMCVVGLDYFSSLAYQPSVAFNVAGPLAPLATLGVILVSLFLVTPLYAYLAGRSPTGQGSVGLLERILPGWRGKFLIVVLLGFAATDLIFTRTFSAADAAEHLLHSPYGPWQRTLDQAVAAGADAQDGVASDFRGLWKSDKARQVTVTVAVLMVGTTIGLFFRKGISRGLVRMSVVAVVLYLVFTAIVVGMGLLVLLNKPDLLDTWWQNVQTIQPEHSRWGFWWPLFVASLLLFPQLALGLSGFELAITTMPLVNGDTQQRIRRTRWMLITAAVLMAGFLLASTLVVTTLVPPQAMKTDGVASNRALAYLAHGGVTTMGETISSITGSVFGVLYDFATVVVLTLSGVVVLIGLRDLVPPYLYQLGMEWNWSRRLGLLTYLFTLLKLTVTYVYKADTDAQRGAYLTGVLALFAAASLCATLDVWNRRKQKKYRLLFRIPYLFILSSVVFVASFVAVVVRTPGGLVLALAFVVLLLLTSMVTRFFRTTEIRVEGFTFRDDASRAEWQELIEHDYPMLVPIRPDNDCLVTKEKQIREQHRVPAEYPLVFIAAELGDPSDFYQRPEIVITRENGRVIVRIAKVVSVPHTIAAAALEIAKSGVVPEVHFGWSGENPLTANLNFVLFGQGNVPWMVQNLIANSKMPVEKKPRVMVG